MLTEVFGSLFIPKAVTHKNIFRSDLMFKTQETTDIFIKDSFISIIIP